MACIFCAVCLDEPHNYLFHRHIANLAEKILRKELAAKDRQQAYIEKLVDEVKDGIKGSDSK